MFEKLRRWLSGPSPFERYHLGLLGNVQKHGWTAVGLPVDEEGPSYIYTIGFWATLGVPDIVISGIDDEPANMILWQAFRDIQSRELKPAEGVPWPGWLQNGAYVWRQVHPTQWTTHNFGSGFWYNETRAADRPAPPPAFQLVSPDFAGVLPWEDGYNEAIRHQQHAFYEARP